MTLLIGLCARIVTLLRKNLKRILVVVGAVVLVLWVKGCINDIRPPEDIGTITPLAPEDQLRVTYSDSHILVQDKTKVVRRHVPVAGSASVTVKKDGQVKIQVKRVGWMFEPGIGVMASDQFRATLDGRFLYFSRFGLVGGIGLSHRQPICIGYVGATYDLDQLRLRNTSLVVSYTTRQDVGIGLRVRF